MRSLEHVFRNLPSEQAAEIDATFQPDEPDPTHWMPGTAEKLQIMAERYQAGQALWHPRDARPGEGLGKVRRAHYTRKPECKVRPRR